MHSPCVRGIGRLAIVSHTFSLPACETGHNLMEIFATPSLPEDAADHDMPSSSTLKSSWFEPIGERLRTTSVANVGHRG